MADLPFLSLRVRDRSLTDGPDGQVVEVLQDGVPVGILAGVTEATCRFRIAHPAEVTVKLDCTFEANGYRPRAHRIGHGPH